MINLIASRSICEQRLLHVTIWQISNLFEKKKHIPFLHIRENVQQEIFQPTSSILTHTHTKNITFFRFFLKYFLNSYVVFYFLYLFYICCVNIILHKRNNEIIANDSLHPRTALHNSLLLSIRYTVIVSIITDVYYCCTYTLRQLKSFMGRKPNKKFTPDKNIFMFLCNIALNNLIYIAFIFNKINSIVH